MTLFQTPGPLGPPYARLRAAHDFVSRCIQYAQTEVSRRREAGRDPTEWESYLRFQQHALRELEDGTLDAWFAD